MSIRLRWIQVAQIVLCALLGSVFQAAPGAPAPAPSSGTTTGAVSEITDQYLRIQPAGEELHRYWFKWIEAGDAKPDKEMLAAVSKLKVGDTVEFKWTLTDRRRIESVKLATAKTAASPEARPKTDGAAKDVPEKQKPPATAPHTAPATSQTASATGPATRPAPEAPESTGSAVNVLLDDLLATANRLLEFPLYVLLAGVGAAAAALWLLLGLACRKGRRPRVRLVLRVVLLAMVVLAAALLLDCKLAGIQGQLTQVRSRMDANAAALLEAVAAARQASRKSFLVDPQEAAARLAKVKDFGSLKLTPMVYDEATDVIQVHRADPVAQGFLVIVDLQNPSLDIRLGTTIQKKRLTTEFARENDCTVAINGEAGASPAPGSGLGEWTGNLIDHGKVILLEDTNQRPFLSFDRKNRAAYSPAAVVDKTVTPEKYNVIWGRVDVLLAGEAVAADWRGRQPRTAMAINKEGTRLYLFVVDGRQPNYSMGMTRAEVGELLRAFGAHDGMLCDEGGSSCIYLKKLGGINNIPCDNRGQERPTYTHFGIALKGDQ